jgi:Phasin protein
MASKETTGSQTAKAGTPPFLNWGQTDAAMAVQKAFMESCDHASRTWLDRMQSEVSLWSDLANKLSTTQSVPEAVEAYSKCVSQRMQMAADDARKFVDESQQMMQKITHSLGNKLPTATT